MLKRLIPLKRSTHDEVAPLYRCGVLNPPRDGLNGVGNFGTWVFLNEVPTLEQIAIGR